MRFFTDGPGRHLVCYPYSVENLHAMARALGIKRCWFHAGRLAHYDVPKRRVVEICMREGVEIVSGRVILAVVKGGVPPAAPIIEVEPCPECGSGRLCEPDCSLAPWNSGLTYTTSTQR